MRIRQIRRLFVALVALHSLVLGAAMLLSPAWTLARSGWVYDGPMFFPAQSGIFLLIFAGAYVVGIWRRPFAWFLVATKAVAVVFLLVAQGLGQAPATAFLAAILDGLMGLAVAAALAAERRAPQAETPAPDKS